MKVLKQTVYSIVAAGLLSFMGILVETSMNVTFPTLMKAMAVNLETIQWITTGYLLVVTMMMIASAHLLKKYPAKNLFLFAIACFTIGTVIAACATNFPVLMMARVIQALSTGISTPLMFHIILTQIPREQTGTYNGMAAMIISLAPALGPTYGGLLTANFSWRQIFWWLLPLILIVFVIGLRNLTMSAADTHDRFDWWGFVIFSACLIAIDFAFNAAGKTGFMSWHFGGYLLIAVILVILLAAYNRHATNHLLDLNIFRNLVVDWHLLAYFLLQFINIGCSFILPNVAQLVLGQDAFVAGLILLPGALLGAFMAPVAGRLLDKVGAYRPILSGVTAMLLGCLAFVISHSVLTVGLICVYFILMRVGFAFAFGNTITNASKQVKMSQKADINAAFNMSQQYAGSLGTGVLAAIIGAYQLQPGKTAVTTAAGAAVDYWLLAILTVVALLSIWNSRRISKKVGMRDDGRF
ncbi:MFS transporter [Lactiplantibacillus fabifermentans]|uniref:Transport protein n=1 Tax=Lactiplantibacillus fabifermentans DSM 21115 TaxID=1413187 RepID=A0A0R2NLG0_9LACO|nr:MFS transporter [Lactiplantibacillus fabifermentans]KRO26607.1 transport protein [Lactiplantibacillus fabifermentans DSM 21115]